MDTDCLQTVLIKLFLSEKSLSLVQQHVLHNVLNFVLNGNICNNSNWMSITVQSISLSVTVSILPRASPTSVSVKLLTPCQQWRRAYLDPVDGWVLVDLSHANIFSESAERGAARVCVNPSTHTHTHAHKHVRPWSSPRARAVWCPSLRHLLTRSVSSLEPDGWSSDPTATRRRITDSRFFFFFFLKMVVLTHVHYISLWSLDIMFP